ncbi:peptide chain release factor N(5)-glutamine methyltransferase [Sphingomonas sp. KC8]|uniref:peptide chain release factor N(5)-glutamine methyltransferase n=1 Tax=Sphingomonas sp. KC8 TaxID=1030157 RepID=UPI0004954F65|nr:peptide chain release factor N(5)-glutamine methyltransferase [Sphingomonas sp. KC8]ARS28181.1 SAM-dependent methyltransferase [Sphingomonas sp. KC8]
MPPDQVGAALAAAARHLAPTSPTPRLDAELLMAHALGCARDTMLLTRQGDAAPAGFASLLARRATGEPVAYITGTRAFWTIDLSVGPGVLIPRPDSETLIEAAVAHFGEAGPANILDLGTGPGTLLLAALAEWPRAQGLGIDASETALAYAARNAGALGLADRVQFQLGDWACGITARFDLILCNPPYVETGGANIGPGVAEYEPHSALFAGADGLDDYRRLAPMIPRLIAPGGIAAIEIGHTQAAAVTALFAAKGAHCTVAADLGGRDRCIIVHG